jgi:hypothetical protein
MSQVTVRRSFGELDLRDKLRSEPDAVFHLFLGQNPLHPFLLRQVGKRAGVDFQSIEPTVAISRRTCGTNPFLTLVA